MYGSFEDNVYNTTKLMKNISNTLWVCTDMLENLMIVKGKEYEQFEDFSTFIASFFQNLLGNVISLNNLYARLSEAVKVGNQTEVVNVIARFLQIIIKFEPISFSTKDAVAS